MRWLYLIAATVVTATPLEAQGWIEPIPGRPDPAVHRLRTTVSVRVVDRIAHVEVEEWFRNAGTGLGEGDYLYPLPRDAVFTSYSLFQGDQELRGETMDADRARAIYEEIVRRKRDPALIELAGHGLIRARVFPIGSGETRKITLRYTQVLPRAGDAVQFWYAAGGRTARHAAEGGTRTGPARPDTPLTFTMVVEDAAAYDEPFSPTHAVSSRRTGGRLTVRPDGQLAGAFALFLPLARPTVGIAVAVYRPSDGEDGYFMLTLSPGEVRGPPVRKDVTAVVDVSGSMSGAKLAQARDALHQLLHSLGEGDRFRLLAFGSTVRSFRPGWVEARHDRARAHEWIDRLQADGGTNIEGALREAFRVAAGDDRLAMVIFLTDGLPSVGEGDPERLAQLAERERGSRRVFAFGVGYDVNAYLLDRLSAAGRGATEYVRPDEDVERALGVLTAKIRHPVLTDLEIAATPVATSEVYPLTLPDLFAGEELVVFGRYRPGRRPAGDVVITGRRNGDRERFATDATFQRHADVNDFIPALWASRKIGFLSQQLRLHGPNEELVEEIRATALRYGLLSEYTSYLVQEPDVVAGPPGRGAADRLAASALPAPQAAVGRDAVIAAADDGRRRTLRSKVEAGEMEQELLGRAHFAQAVHESGRLFTEVDGVWTDLGHADGRVVTIAAFSEAYFAVLERLLELKPYAARFERVLVAGGQISIEIAEHGREAITPGVLERLAEAFRGR